MRKYTWMQLLAQHNFWPKHWETFIVLFTIFIGFPSIMAFELAVIFANVHYNNTILYCLDVFLGIFFIYNVLGNLFCCMIIDTRVATHALDISSLTPVTKMTLSGVEWHFCKFCNKFAPPRAWHCKICGVCILKRDHHCNIAGNCIGLYNHRYFIMFLLHFFLCSIYVYAYNTIYCMANGISLPRLMAVLARPSFRHEETLTMFELLLTVIYVLNTVSALATGIPLLQHLSCVRYGGVTRARGKENNKEYDAGLLKNLEYVFGDRMAAVWVCPFIKSDLHNNGMSWKKAPTRV